MYSPQCGRFTGRIRVAVPIRPAVFILLLRHIGLFALSCSAACAVSAQNANTLDCSDPLLATTQACSNQTQQGTSSQQPLGSTGTYGGTYGSSLANPSENGNANYRPNLPSTYSDIEQLSRQPVQPGQRQPEPLPLEPLTEFQKFVASTTNLILPVYGANRFRRVPSTFAPVDMAPVPSDYVIGPGDELRIRIWGQVSMQTNVRVDRSGEIYLPQVGQVHVAGLAFADLDTHLREAVGRVFHNFDLTVDLGQIRAIQVYVSGQARRPGVYTVSSLSTLVDALFASGGPSVEGSMRAIELRRGGTVVARFDLYDLLIKGDKTKDAKLLAGDVIFIPPAGPQAAVYGSVRNPAIFELQPQETLAGLLTDAGGVSTMAAEARVSIERIDEHRDRHAMEAAYDPAGLATGLADGDMVRVYSIVPKYQKTVTLRGNTANPGRFAWHEGMRVSELIPDKESLLTRNYWWRRSQLGLPAPEFEPIPGFANLRQPTDNHAIVIPQISQRQGPSGQSQTGFGVDQAAPGTEQFGPQTPYSYGQQIPNSVPNQFGAEPAQSVPQQSGTGYGQGSPLTAQQRAGSAPLASQMTVNPSQAPLGSQRTDVRLMAPEIDWDYALIERLNPETLKTQLISFDLGKLVLQHDTSQDLELQPGDVVSVFSEADIGVPFAEQTKLVRLEGEFVHAGVYSAQPGETLQHLVERAGVLRQNEYLYASEFTRVSTRAVQQARIDEYVQSLTLSIERGVVGLAS